MRKRASSQPVVTSAAVWALRQYGFRALISPSFADIFHKNCFENGLVPVIIPEDKARELIRRAKEGPPCELTVDLERCEIYDDRGFRSSFVIHDDPATHEFRRHCLLNGLDDIDLTFQHGDEIAAFEAKRPTWLEPSRSS
jgi:3-isopropylmalate/(R)-2-methylmalate dehydratase small subunit